MLTLYFTDINTRSNTPVMNRWRVTSPVQACMLLLAPISGEEVIFHQLIIWYRINLRPVPSYIASLQRLAFPVAGRGILFTITQTSLKIFSFTIAGNQSQEASCPMQAISSSPRVHCACPDRDSFPLQHISAAVAQWLACLLAWLCVRTSLGTLTCKESDVAA